MKRKGRLFVPVLIGLLAAAGIFQIMYTTVGDASTTEGRSNELSLKEKTQIWVDTRLGKKTVKEYHQKVHRSGTQCDLCHGAQNPVSPPDDANCLKCHGSPEQVAQLTATLEKNPHDSPHYGTGAPCTVCHREHEPSEAICSECHLFVFEKLI